MATRTANNKTYYINPAYLTFVENSGYGANLIQVSASSSCYISVYDPANGINYSDADKNYLRWKVTAYNNKFPDDDVKYPGWRGKWHIYVQLEVKGTSALVIYDQVLRGVHGGEIVEKTDDQGNVTKVEGEYDPDHAYYYIHIGEVGATNGTTIREITYDTGYLVSDRGLNDANDLNEMWELDKYSTPWLIHAKHGLDSFTVKGEVSLMGKINFKNNDTEKPFTDIKRSTDNDEEAPVSDEVLPTAKFVDLNFLNSEKEDTAKEFITFLKGLMSGGFTSGEFGSGFILKNTDGRSYMEIDELLVRKIAYFVQLTIKKLEHVGGTIILSPASMRCVKVNKHFDYYRCYFQRNHEGKTVKQEFRVGDFARCQEFNVHEGDNSNAKSHYYWRKVVGVSSENMPENAYGYIDLSIDDCDAGSVEPRAGDDIVQLGHESDSTRQNAIILSTIGDDAPSFKQYANIHSYKMEEATLVTMFSPSENRITAGALNYKGDELSNTIDQIKVNWDKVLAQTDKEFTMWFFEYSPDPDRLPEVEWDTDDLKALHEEDLFYNTDKSHKEYGRAWRYTYDDTTGTYIWAEVTDESTIAALEKAFAAQGTADSAISELEKITSDDYLSRDEKKEVRREWEEITICRERHLETAENFGLTVENCQQLADYEASYMSLGNYMSGAADGVFELGMIPLWIADEPDDKEDKIGMTEHTPIDGAVYRSEWKAYYDAEKKLQNFFSTVARDKADDAQATADESMDEMRKIASDEWLTVAEKASYVIPEWNRISGNYAKYLDNAKHYGVDTEAYEAAYYSLGSYLNGDTKDETGEKQWEVGIMPEWLEGLGAKTNEMIDPSLYKKLWHGYYSSEVDLLQAISKAIDRMGSGNVQVFTDIPVPPYHVGDRWNGAYWEIDGKWFYEDEYLVCWTSKEEGEVFDISDWRPVSSSAISEIKTNSQGVEIISRAFSLDEENRLVVSEESGLVTTSNFSTLFAKAVTSEGEAKEALLTVAVTKNADGTLDSSVKIKADNISINGIVKGSDENSVVIGGFDINKNTITGGLSGTTLKLSVSDSANNHPSISWGDSDRDYIWVGMYEISGYKSGTMNLFFKDRDKDTLQSLNILPYKMDFNGARYGHTIYVDDGWAYSKWTATNNLDLGELYGEIGMSAASETNSFFKIRSNSWPSSGQVFSGDVYKDDSGYLRVKE